jgi:hypothetical protein
MSNKYEFYYFDENNFGHTPDRMVTINCQDDNSAFTALDAMQEYLNQSRSPDSVLLFKDGKNMSNEFLAWIGGGDEDYVDFLNSKDQENL